eukprot:10375177-Alexandrium_andersonii.AAC.1
MSASLVGSEMCIRDSMSAQLLQSTTREAIASKSARVAAGSGLPAPAAVSYTHLTLPTICSV